MTSTTAAGLVLKESKKVTAAITQLDKLLSKSNVGRAYVKPPEPAGATIKGGVIEVALRNRVTQVDLDFTSLQELKEDIASSLQMIFIDIDRFSTLRQAQKEFIKRRAQKIFQGLEEVPLGILGEIKRGGAVYK